MDKITFSKIGKKCCSNARKKPPRIFDKNALQGSNRFIRALKASNTGFKYTRTCSKNIKLYFRSKGFYCGTQTFSEFINSDECNPPQPILINIDPRNVVKWDNRTNSWEHYVRDDRKFFNPIILNDDYIYDSVNKWDVLNQNWFLIDPNEMINQEIEENELAVVNRIVLRDNIFKVTMTDTSSNNTIFYLRYEDDGRGLDNWKYWKNWTMVPDISGVSSVSKNTFTNFQILASRDSVNLFRTRQFMDVKNNPFIAEIPKPREFKDSNNLFVWEDLYTNTNYKNFTYRIDKINPDTIPDFYGFGIPENLSAVSFQDRQILINWNASKNYTFNRTIHGYRIESRLNNTEEFSLVKDVSANILSTTITGLTNGFKYFIKVYPFTNTIDTNIEIGSSVVTGVPGSPPRNPISLAGEGNLIREELLSWLFRENISGFEVTNFEIQFKRIELGETFPWSEKIVVFKNTLLPIYSVKTTSIEYQYKVPNLQNGITYVYRIRAKNILGYSIYEESNQFKTADIPASPSFSSVPIEVTEPSIDISWNKPFNGGRTIIGYRVEFSTQPNGPWSIFKSNTNTSDTKITLSFGCLKPATYWFRVAGINSVGLGKYGLSVNYRTDGTGVIYHKIPPLPVDLIFLIQSPASINLYWRNPDIFLGADITYHSIGYSSDSGATWTYINTGTYQTNFIITDLANDTSYQVKIATGNAAGLSEYTTPQTITTAAVPIQPIITSLSSSIDSVESSSDEITLVWNTPYSILPLTNYIIKYKTTSASSYTILSINDTTLTSKTITNLTVGQTYDISFAASNDVGTGLYASTSYHLQNVTSPPYNLIGQINSSLNGSIDLFYNRPTNLGDGGLGTVTLISYQIQVKKTTESDWTTLATQPSSPTTSFTVDISAPEISIATEGENKYVFRVSALSTVGFSAYSNETTEIPCGLIPDAPLNVSSTPIFGVGSMYVNWDLPESNGSNIFSYKIEYKLNTSSTWTTVFTNSSNTNYIINSLTSLTDYNFRVTAQNRIGFGVTSAIVTARTAGPSLAPSKLTILVKDEEVVLSWTTPTDNGGLDIVNYDISRSEMDFDYKKTYAGLTVEQWTSNYPNGGTYNSSNELTGVGTWSNAAFASYVASKTTVNDKHELWLLTQVGTPGYPQQFATRNPAGSTGPSPVKSSWPFFSPNTYFGTNNKTQIENAAVEDTVNYTGTNVKNQNKIVVTTYPIANNGSNTTTYTYFGLTNGTSYQFSVRAITGRTGSIFQSPYSNIVSGTPTTSIYSYPDTLTCGGEFQYTYISSIQYDLANNIVKLKIDSSYNEVGIMDQYGNILSTDKYARRAQINVSQSIYTYNDGFTSPVTDTIPIQGRGGLRLPLYNGNDDPRSGFFQYKMFFKVEYEDTTSSPSSWIQISNTSGTLVYIGDILAPDLSNPVDQDKNIYINIANMLTNVGGNNFTQVERWSGTFLSGKNIRITYLSGGTTP